MKTFTMFDTKDEEVTFESYRRDHVWHEYQDSSWDKVKHLKYSFVNDIYYNKACELCQLADYGSNECRDRCENHKDWTRPEWKKYRTLEFTRDSTDEEWDYWKDWRAGVNRRALEEEEADDDVRSPIGMKNRVHHQRQRPRPIRATRQKKRPSIIDLAFEFLAAEEKSFDSDIADPQGDADASEASEDDSSETEAAGADARILGSESGFGGRRILEAFRRRRV
jgi:hypothetical protein